MAEAASVQLDPWRKVRGTALNPLEIPRPGFEVAHLSPREAQIVVLVAAGLTNSMIARVLRMSEQTVKNHVGKVFLKTNTHCRTELSVWAWGHGMVR